MFMCKTIFDLATLAAKEDRYTKHSHWEQKKEKNSFAFNETPEHERFVLYEC